MEDIELGDSMLEAIVEDALVDKFEHAAVPAVILITPLGDGVGFKASVLSGDGETRFGQASASSVVLAVSNACARATATLQEFQESLKTEDDEYVGGDDE